MFIPIKKILSQNVRQAGIGRQIEAAKAVEEFDKIISEMFGKNILNKARAMYLKNKILTVSCLSSFLKQEIYLKQKKIIKELNKRLGGEAVNVLKFRM
jgi:hypothetical protein